MLKLKFKKLLNDVQLPIKMHNEDACFDVFCPNDVILEPNKITKVNLNFAVECPDGYKLCFYSRSGLASKGVLLSNSVGIIDQNYRGACMVALYNVNSYPIEIHRGDRIVQCALEKVILFEIEETTELSETTRGHGGFGSTGK